MNPTHLIWLDLETTGLDPTTDQILEICAYIADFNNPFEAKRLYHAVFNCTDMSKVSPIVREMHARNGLWSECIVSEKWVGDAVDQVLIAMLPKGDGKLVLAGFSVHFDLSFIRVHLKRFAYHLSHRVYDVSAVKLFCRSLGMPENETPKEEAHRAEADVLESINHAQICAHWMDECRSSIRTNR